MVSALKLRNERLNMNNELFRIDEKNRRVILLGYELKLTRGEYDTLRVINLSDGYISAEELCEMLRSDAATEHSVSVHISNINRKAEAISGRILVETKRYKGYRISEYI